VNRYFAQDSGNVLGQGQNHLAVAGGCAAFSERLDFVPTRYREVVLTLSKSHDRVAGARIESY